MQMTPWSGLAVACAAQSPFKAGLLDKARGVIGQVRDFAQTTPADDDPKINGPTGNAFAVQSISLDDLAGGVLQFAMAAAPVRVGSVDKIADLSDIARRMSLPDN